ncbi:hypothetical protein ABZT17_25180 [Streptomyces sp. NPDC005648]|uniref:hypothetical protein n=1 Tax=Streptomyces sp. NPDC005648 TaxID=3157044 RepID=UPI0033A3A0CA
MFGLVTQQAREAHKSSGPRPVVGEGPITHSLTTHGAPVAQRPVALTALHTAQPDPQAGGLASSVRANPGSADVQHLDLRHGAGPGHFSVDPSRPTFHTAPTGARP